MNKVFISGLISETPVFRMEASEIPHLILSLCVRHKTGAGKDAKGDLPRKRMAQCRPLGR